MTGSFFIKAIEEWKEEISTGIMFIIMFTIFIFSILNFIVKKEKKLDKKSIEILLLNNSDDKIILKTAKNINNNSFKYCFYNIMIKNSIEQWYKYKILEKIDGYENLISKSLELLYESNNSLVKKLKEINSIEKAKKYRKRETELILYGIISIYLMFESENDIKYKSIQNYLDLKNNFTWWEKRKIKYCYLKIFDEIIYEPEIVKSLISSNYLNEWEIENIIFTFTVLNLIHYSKEKFNFFVWLRITLSPFELIEKWFR